MKISFSPQRRDDALVIEKTIGDRLRINGELYNFNSLEEGDEVPAGAIPTEWIIGPVRRGNGEIDLTILLPHGPNPPQHVAFPEPIIVTENGLIALPTEENFDVVA